MIVAVLAILAPRLREHDASGLDTRAAAVATVGRVFPQVVGLAS
jgi:hypothetical protein